MVRRLVEEQDIGPAKEDACHRHAHFPSPGERANVAVDPLVVESQAVQNFARLTLERITAEMLVFLLDLPEARQDAIHVIGPRRVRHRLIQRLELVV